MGQYGQGAYESWTPVQIFDPTTANMVLSSMDRYSALLQRERERALQEEKDFLKDYGDFYSSVPGATEAYYNEGVGKIQNAIAQAQAAGIDLTRSIEGRNLLHRLVTSVDVGKMNQLKQQKEAYDNYNKALDTLVLKGEITPEQAAWKRKNDGVDTFTALDGNKVNMFNGTVAGPMQDLNSFVDTVAGNIEKSFIKTEGGYDFSGVSEDRIRSVVGDTLNEYLNTDGGAYAFDQYMKAKGYDLDQLTEDQRKALRNDPNEIAEFKEYATDLAVSKREGIDRKLNPTSYIGTGSRSAGGYGSSSSSSSGGGYGGTGDEYSYDHQLKYLNQGVAKLLNVPESTISFPRKNKLDLLKRNQTAVMRANYTESAEGNHYDKSKILNTLSIPYTQKEVADVLGFNQFGEDASNGVYSIFDTDLPHIYSVDEIFDNLAFEDNPNGFTYEQTPHPSAKKSTSQSIRNYAKSALKSEADDAKITPTGDVVTYLRKDGRVKQMAKAKLKVYKDTGKKDPTTNEPILKYSETIVYVDFGTTSTTVSNNPNDTIFIDRSKSTLRAANWNDVQKKGYKRPEHTDYNIY